MIDVISIGDVTEDVFVEVDHVASLHCTMPRCAQKNKNKTCHLDFPFGTKLAITKVHKLLGGNAGNVAIGCSRMGLTSALYSEVGDDSQGQLLYDSLQQNNVSTKYFFRKKGAATNYSVVLHYQGERTILVHHEPRVYKLPPFTPAKAVYLTSMAQGSEEIFPTVLQYIKKHKPLLGFNPGTHQLYLGLKKLWPLLQATTFLSINTEEAQLLLKTHRRDFPFLLRKLQKQGPRIVIITDGAKGSYCYDGSSYYFCPIYEVPIVERTGCGDAFSTGFLSALLYKQPVSEALRWGTINSASVLQRIGPQEGLMTISRLRKILQANHSFQARLFTGKEAVRTSYIPKKIKGF